VQVAVPGVEDVGDAQPRVDGHGVDALQHLGEAGADGGMAARTGVCGGGFRGRPPAGMFNKRLAEQWLAGLRAGGAS